MVLPRTMSRTHLPPAFAAGIWFNCGISANSVGRSSGAFPCHGSGVDTKLSHLRCTKKSRSKRFLSPCTYYANCIARQQIELLRSSDIERNPGPTRISRKCQVCEKTIRKTSKMSHVRLALTTAISNEYRT